MTRSELVIALVEKNKHLSFYDAQRVINVFFNEISNSLIAGNRVELRGFGAFSIKKRRARLGRNPRNGDAVTIEEKNAPIFKIGKRLFERMNGKQ